MPRAAKQMKVQGSVTLQLLISENGDVLDIVTLRSSEQLEKSGCVKAAHNAVVKWKFEPAVHQGVRVKTHYHIMLPFRQ